MEYFKYTLICGASLAILMLSTGCSGKACMSFTQLNTVDETYKLTKDKGQ